MPLLATGTMILPAFWRTLYSWSCCAEVSPSTSESRMWQRLTSLQTGLTTGSISKSAIFLRRKIQIGNLRRWRPSRITTKSLFCPRIRCCGSIVEGSVKRTLLTFYWNIKYAITQEREKDGTAEAEPSFFTKIIAAGSSAPKHNHQDLCSGDPTDRCHSESLHPKAVRPASCIRLAHGGSP